MKRSGYEACVKSEERTCEYVLHGTYILAITFGGNNLDIQLLIFQHIWRYLHMRHNVWVFQM